TPSERLASELSYLLLGRGIISGIHKRGNNSVWDVVITNRLQIKKCDYLNGIGDIKLQEFLRQPHVVKVPIEKSGIIKILERMFPWKITSGGSLGHKRFHEKKLERIIQLCESRGINVDHLKKLINGDLAFAQIKRIRKVRPTKTFVYDLSVPGCENFIGGFGGVCLHNSEDERILHYALADLCVFPSISEPFGIVSLEAMSMEKPVVVGAAGVNGLREQVIPSGENRTGVHVNGENPQDIAWGIKEILRNFEEAKKWGKNGRKRVLKEFTWERAAKRTLEIYEKVIK
ncbi:MAG: glycosyltransferase, partial [Candidatus Aenigmatarchaeota archaeon]